MGGGGGEFHEWNTKENLSVAKYTCNNAPWAPTTSMYDNAIHEIIILGCHPAGCGKLGAILLGRSFCPKPLSNEGYICVPQAPQESKNSLQLQKQCQDTQNAEYMPLSKSPGCIHSLDMACFVELQRWS